MDPLSPRVHPGTLLPWSRDCEQAPATPSLVRFLERGSITFIMYSDCPSPPDSSKSEHHLEQCSPCGAILPPTQGTFSNIWEHF